VTTERWSSALLVVAVLIAGYGAGLVVAGPSAARLFDVLGFGMASGGVPDGRPQEYVLLVYGVLGAVLVGWMSLVAGLAAGPLRRGDRSTWRLIAVSTALWFAVDTTFSLAAEWWAHALFNVAFVVAIGIPLVGWRLAAQTGMTTSDGSTPRMSPGSDVTTRAPS
jgi:hypothetical protein